MIAAIGHNLFGLRLADEKATARLEMRRRRASLVHRWEKSVPLEAEGPDSRRGPEPADPAGPAAWETDCVARALDGDTTAFGKLVDEYSARIFTHLYRLVGNREEAEDLAQESFLRAYRFLARYDRSKPFRNWLYTIATNVAMNALRARRRRGWSVSLDAESTEGLIAADTKDARQHLAHREQETRVADAVGRLPAQSASLVHLHYHEGMSIREAADIVGVSEGAAKVALHRARKSLRIWLIESEES